MSVAALGGVGARIAEIEQRFAAVRPPGFRAALAGAVAQTEQAPGGIMPALGLTVHGRAGQAPVPGDWAEQLPEAGRGWAAEIERAAADAGVDPRLLAALVWAESGFRPQARSHAGAVGLAQLMPGTARGLGVDPHDPAQNLAGGARYLAAQIERFGDVGLALAAYNAGPNRVAQAGGIPDIAETRAYVPRVLGYFDRLGASR